MAIPVAVVAAWIGIAERLAALWGRIRRKGGGQAGGNGKWPPAARPRPPRLPLDGPRVTLALLGAAALLAGAGCATVGEYGASSLEELVALCEQVSPCTPCDPCPEVKPCPECPKCPETKPEKPEGCDRDGLPPSGTFVWKPASDNDGRLAVVTPASATCEKGLTIHYNNGKKSEKGASNGARANGCRLSWRFSRPGGQYGRNIHVVCAEATGNRTWTVPLGSARYEAR